MASPESLNELVFLVIGLIITSGATYVARALLPWIAVSVEERQKNIGDRDRSILAAAIRTAVFAVEQLDRAGTFDNLESKAAIKLDMAETIVNDILKRPNAGSTIASMIEGVIGEELNRLGYATITEYVGDLTDEITKEEPAAAQSEPDRDIPF